MGDQAILTREKKAYPARIGVDPGYLSTWQSDPVLYVCYPNVRSEMNDIACTAGSSQWHAIEYRNLSPV